jgi:hypothetical protein
MGRCIPVWSLDVLKIHSSQYYVLLWLDVCLFPDANIIVRKLIVFFIHIDKNNNTYLIP